MKPMVELTLFGNLNFGKGDIPVDAIKNLLETRYSPIYNEVRVQRTDSDYAMNRGDIGGLSREQIELRVLSDMVRKDSRYRQQVDDVARTLIDVKKLAAGGAAAAGIVKKMRESFERIQGDRC
ncbi:MAG TPA: hypothetical protein HA257_01190 [Candidatus Methanoperedenaceae archaeon]|nr:hypothetical protein [Candidatus Methanoperedenaceae archaeon]